MPADRHCQTYSLLFPFPVRRGMNLSLCHLIASVQNNGQMLRGVILLCLFGSFGICDTHLLLASLAIPADLVGILKRFEIFKLDLRTDLVAEKQCQARPVVRSRFLVRHVETCGN